MNFINNFLTYSLDINDSGARTAAVVFIIVCIFCIVLRFLLCLAYNAAKSGFALFVNEMNKKKADPRHMKSLISPTTTKIIAEYITIGEKGITNIDAQAIVRNRISKLNFLGISYLNIEEFVDKIEQVSIFAGLILALVYEYPKGFGVISIGVYVLFRFIAIFLNYRLIREQLCNDLVSFVDREVGQYYIGDLTSAIQRLKVELVVAITNQGNFIEKTMKEMQDGLSLSIKAGMDEVANNVNLTMESLSKYSEYMDEPFKKWEESVNKATLAQNALFKTLEQINAVSASFEQTQTSIEKNLGVFVNTCVEQTHAMGDLGEKLVQNSQELMGKYDNVSVLNESIGAQLQVFSTNQTVMEESINKYELSLREITTSLSGAIGSIVGHHIEKAYYDLNNDLKDNIKTITTSNIEVINKIENSISEIVKIENTKKQFCKQVSLI